MLYLRHSKKNLIEESKQKDGVDDIDLHDLQNIAAKKTFN